MLEVFQDHLERTGLIPPGVSVLVGYSGGPDSTCLLHLLKRAGRDVVAAHLHHGQRPEADDEARKCEEFADQLGVPFVQGRADVPAMAKHLRMGLEEAGRNARYEFFRRAARSVQCPLIATGHTRDDHLETILLNLTRGTGLAGLAGIPAHRGDLVRPLLPFTRAQTRQYCEDLGLWFHDDPTNFDEGFGRVRIRNRVLPELRLVHPGAEDSLLRLSERADEENRFLDSAAAAALERCELPLNGELRFLSQDCEIAFERASLLHLPPVLLRRALRLAVQSLGGSLDAAQTEAVLAGIRWESKGSVTAEGGSLAVEWEESMLRVRHLEVDESFRFPLTVPGETVSEAFGWVLEARRSEFAGARARTELSVDLSEERLAGDLYFRSMKEGDRMAPAGFGHERKLSDLLGEAKLTVAARKRLPIICDMVGPVWIPGVAGADRAVATRSGERVIRLTLSPWSSDETSAGT